MTGKILEAELRITGKDGTGAAFAGVLKRAEELKKSLAGLQGMRIGGADFQAANAALREQTVLLRTERIAAQEVNRAISAGNAAIEARTGLLTRMHQRWQGIAQAGGMGWMFGGIASGRAAKSIAHDATEFEDQKALLPATGMKPDEIERAVKQAWALRVPTMTAAENLKATGELRTVFGSTDHAIEHLVAVQRATASMKVMNPQLDASNESYNLARALEIKGVSNDPVHFTRLANMMVQAINATRGKVTGSEFFEFTKYTRGGANRLSDEFYTRIAPTLIQELGGHSAGMALSSFRQTLVGGKMTNKAAEEFVKLGLINSNAVIKTKTGSVKGIRPGGIVGSDLANEDPFAWVQKYLKPALDKKHITDPNKIAEELAHLFGNRNSEQMASILLNQVQRIEKDRGLIEGAPGTESLEETRHKHPTTAMKDMAAGMNNLLASLGGPLVAPAISAMNRIADGTRGMAERYATLAKNNPLLAEVMSGGGALGLGYVGLKGVQSMFGLVTGSTALKGSALALNESAAALNGAALRMGGGSAVPEVVKGAAAGGAAVIGTGAAVAVGGAILSKIATNVVANSGDYFSGAIDDYGIAYHIMNARKNNFPGEEFTADDLKPLSRLSMMNLQAGLPQEGYPKAEITGSADIITKITVEPSPDFITRVETMISNAIKGISLNGAPGKGSSGSTGRSMPESGSWQP